MLGLFEILVIAFILLVVVATTRQAARKSKAEARPNPAAQSAIDVTPAGAGLFEPVTATRFIKDSLSARVPRVLLVVIRVVLGSFWLGSGWHWMTTATTTEMARRINDLLATGQSYGLIGGFAQETVLPWIGTVAFLVTVAELLVGLSLTFGAATRLGAALGMYLAFNYACLAGDPLLPVGGHWLTFFYLLPILLGAAGRSFGADYWLHRRYPRLPLW